MKIVIDRIEGDVAVVEIAGRCVDVPLVLLPEGCKEGDTLAFARGAPPDHSAAEARLARLKSRGPQGPGRVDR